jgi:RNA polymerase sigma-70 factor (ECF subfamily)
MPSNQDDLYKDVASGYGPALDRLARAYEANPEERRDLLQEIHLALWRSFEGFDGRCSLRTWVYRVAHNVATSHVIRQRKKNSVLVRWRKSRLSRTSPGCGLRDQRVDLDRLMALIQF